VIQKKVQAFILRESVVLLHNEEILQKIPITETDILNHYSENYELFTLDMIEARTEEEALGILSQLRDGSNFRELAVQNPVKLQKNADGFVTIQRRSLAPALGKSVSLLKTGERSDVIREQGKFFIVQLIKREEAPGNKMKDHRATIANRLRKQKEKERSDQYLKYLRNQASVTINREIFESMKFEGQNSERETWLKDKRILAQVNGSTLTAGAFIAMTPRDTSKANEQILNNWINIKLVDYEALRRRYDMNPPLENSVRRYKNELIKNAFFIKVINPQIVITEEVLKDYYMKHQQDFLKPVRYKIQIISLKTEEKAQEVLKSLQNGANFSWLAKKVSKDGFAEKGGTMGWVTRERLPEPAKGIMDSLKPGDISHILDVPPFYIIVRLQDKTKEEVEEFHKVKKSISRAHASEKFITLYEEYIDRLKGDAQIVIHEDAVIEFKKRFEKTM
jgi:parvulin-like peptidyl-prolyl isomerase